VDRAIYEKRKRRRETWATYLAGFTGLVGATAGVSGNSQPVFKNEQSLESWHAPRTRRCDRLLEDAVGRIFSRRADAPETRSQFQELSRLCPLRRGGGAEPAWMNTPDELCTQLCSNYALSSA
jgi:hypothetical protein